MNYTNTVKKLLLILAGVVILAALASWIISKKTKPTQESAPRFLESNIQKTDVPENQVPAKFPTEIPIEAGAKIVQNYNASTNDNLFQATRVFESKKTLTESFGIYQTFFQNNGWEVKSSVNQQNYKMLFATKGNAQLQVSIDNNIETEIKTINISYTELTN